MSKIKYPRECPHCDYQASSPQTYCYHLRKHDPIPEGQLCDHGCGQQSKYKNTNNKYTCEEKYASCPAYLERHSKKVTKQWKEASDERREQTLKTFVENTQTPESIEKAKATKRNKLLAFALTRKFRQYKWAVHSVSQRTYKEYKNLINPNNYPRGITKYHLDHKVSKHVGWLLKIPPEYLAAQHNLQILYYTENIQKDVKCSIHPIELLEECRAPKEIVERVTCDILQLSDSFEQLFLL
ncbi:hypothetical protein LCGC14_2102570, partial [marine sediment metagenome]